MKSFHPKSISCSTVMKHVLVALVAAVLLMPVNALASHDAEGAFGEAAAAITASDPEKLRALVTSTPSLVSEADAHGDTLLNIAAQQGELEAVRILIAAGADPDGAENRPIESVLNGLRLRDIGLEGAEKTRAVFIEIFHKIVTAGANYDFIVFDYPFIPGVITEICSDLYYSDPDLEALEGLPMLRIEKTSDAEQALNYLSAVADVQDVAGACTAVFLQKIETE